MSPRGRRPAHLVDSDTETDLGDLLADATVDDATATYQEFVEAGQPVTETPPNVASEETPPRRIRAVGPRRSTETLFSGLYGMVGTALVHTGTDIPVGRVLTFQSPIAGARIDEIIAYTWLDKIIQPLVAYEDKAKGLGSLFLLPLMVGAYERQPSLAGFPVFEQILRGVVESALMEMAPVLKKQAADRKKAARTVADLTALGAELGLDGEAMKDPVGAIIGGFFYTPETETSEGEGE